MTPEDMAGIDAILTTLLVAMFAGGVAALAGLAWGLISFAVAAWFVRYVERSQR